jgi:hypothetical protein
MFRALKVIFDNIVKIHTNLYLGLVTNMKPGLPSPSGRVKSQNLGSVLGVDVPIFQESEMQFVIAENMNSFKRFMEYYRQ